MSATNQSEPGEPTPTASAPVSGSAFCLRRKGYMIPLNGIHLDIEGARFCKNYHAYLQADELEIVEIKIGAVVS